VLVSALLASLVSATAFAFTFIAGTVPTLPLEVDAFFARFIASLIQCGIAAGLVWVWQRIRKPTPK
jgi:hypothetical protein